VTEALEPAIRAACGNPETAVTLAIRGYGPELLGYLNAMLRDPAAADDVFSGVCEKLWRGLPAFGWESSFRTWAYTVTRNACVSFLRGARKSPSSPGNASLDAIVAEVRTKTATFLRTDTKDRLAEVRDTLEPDDQTLLILRIDRKLPWRDIARVFEPEPATDAALDRRAAALRKRLERLKVELRERIKR
jgi:RNA polymerase sigma-70 factor, ECF subfamily